MLPGGFKGEVADPGDGEGQCCQAKEQVQSQALGSREGELGGVGHPRKEKDDRLPPPATAQKRAKTLESVKAKAKAKTADSKTEGQAAAKSSSSRRKRPHNDSDGSVGSTQNKAHKFFNTS